MENLKTEKFYYDDDRDIIDVQGAEVASFGADGFKVTAQEVITEEFRENDDYGSEGPIAQKSETSFSPGRKHQNYGDGDYKDLKHKQNIRDSHAKEKGSMTERGGHPLK